MCIPTSYTWTFDLVKTFFRNINFRSKNKYSQDPQKYFSKIPLPKYGKYHKDSGDHIYSHYLNRSKAIQYYKAKKGLKIYDLGAGFGNLFDKVKFHPSSNINLIDFVDKNLKFAKNKLIEYFQNVQTTKTDLRNCELIMDNADMAFCINVLPYIPDPEHILKFASNLLKERGHFFTIHPLKSPVWEETFEGVTIIFHENDLIKELASKYSLNEKESTDIQFAIPGTFRKINFFIAKLNIFEKLT